jgi:hypothetical protein
MIGEGTRATIEAIMYRVRERGLGALTEPENPRGLCRLMDDNVSLDRACAEIARPSGAAASTVEALMFGLRERGVAALNDPKVQRRLAEISDGQQ